MKVLIVGEGFSVEDEDPGRSPAIDIIGTQAIDFTVDFGPMMDRWGGSVAIADIEPIDGDTRLYRVINFRDVPVVFRQTSDDAFVLDDVDGTWRLSFTGGIEGFEVTRTGEFPDFEDERLAPLGSFLESLRPDTAPEST